MDKLDRNISITRLKENRRKILEIESQIKRLRKYEKEKEILENSCPHSIGIFVASEDYLDNNLEDYYCLECNKMFLSIVGLDSVPFRKIIDFQSIDLETMEKVSLAYDMFVAEKERKPKKTDYEIVDLINKKIRHTDITKTKVKK